MEQEQEETKEVSLGTLYDLNKAAMKTQKELSTYVINNKQELLRSYISDTDNKYYMLLCKELSDYTIIVFKDINKKDYHFAAKELTECLTNRGAVKGIDRTKDNGAIEIWIEIADESYCYYFFPYDSAIVEV